MTRKSLVFLALLVSSMLAGRTALALHRGEMAVVVKDTDMRVTDRTTATFYRGDVVRVVDVRDGKICVGDRSVGWIDASCVVSLKKGVDCFEAALRNDPKDVSAYFGRASIQEAMGHHDKAIADCG